MKKKGLLIGIDRMRPDALQIVDKPYIDALVNDGLYAWNTQTEPRTVSRTVWTSLLTGVHTKH